MHANQTPCRLRGLSVLVTRPEQQAQALCEHIERAGGRAVRFPAIEIVPCLDEDSRSRLGQAGTVDLLIFVSANAVEHAFSYLPETLPLDLPIAAVGTATARSLEAYGLSPTMQPEARFDTEGLLALPTLQHMQGQRVLIVRGRGGREKLRQVLMARGARVEYAEVYARQCPARDPRHLLANWSRLVQAVTVTSREIFDNLWGMLGEEGQALLQRTPLVALSARIADHAYRQGCRAIWVADRASDEGIVHALCEINEEMQ